MPTRRRKDRQRRRDHFEGGGGAVRNWRAMRRALLRIARTALDIVIVARDTASTSSPSLNGSRTSLLRNVRGELRRVDREVAVRLVVLADDDAGELARGVEPDQHRDGTAVAALERQDLRRPEGVADDGLRRRPAGVGGEVRRIAFLRRE